MRITRKRVVECKSVNSDALRVPIRDHVAHSIVNEALSLSLSLRLIEFIVYHPGHSISASFDQSQIASPYG